MQMTQMSIKEYAAIRKTTKQAVWNRIKAGKELPGVKKVTKFKNFIVLTISDLSDITVKNATTLLN